MTTKTEETERIVSSKVKGLLDMGYKPIYELITESGRAINTTGNHPYLTPEGWIKIAELEEGESIAVPISQKSKISGNLENSLNFQSKTNEKNQNLPSDFRYL